MFHNLRTFPCVSQTHMIIVRVLAVVQLVFLGLLLVLLCDLFGVDVEEEGVTTERDTKERVTMWERVTALRGERVAKLCGAVLLAQVPVLLSLAILESRVSEVILRSSGYR